MSAAPLDPAVLRRRARHRADRRLRGYGIAAISLALGLLAVLIVSYRRADLLERALASVDKWLPDVRVHVWDNASSGSAQVRELAATRDAFSAYFEGEDESLAVPVDLTLVPSAFRRTALETLRAQVGPGDVADEQRVAAEQCPGGVAAAGIAQQEGGVLGPVAGGVHGLDREVAQLQHPAVGEGLVRELGPSQLMDVDRRPGRPRQPPMPGDVVGVVVGLQHLREELIGKSLFLETLMLNVLAYI